MKSSGLYDDAAERTRMLVDRPVVIIGLMGAGKTKVGRLLAQRLRLPFADSDEEIERAAGLPVSEIFEKFGENYFRDGERRVLERLLAEGIKIIATGGGAVMTPSTADLIWSRSISIWLRADIPLLVERTARRDTRPLLKNGEPETILNDLADRRYPVYGKADIIVDTHRGPVEAIVNLTIEKLDQFLRKGSRKKDA